MIELIFNYLFSTGSGTDFPRGGTLV